jgi:UDP-glucose 4-epimerase
MKVAIVGATGNMGSALLRALEHDERVREIVGIARRLPDREVPKVTWRRADIVTDDLAPVFEGADVVVHLAWLIQPSRDEQTLHAVNVEGSRRVFEAAAHAGAGALVYASSVGAYSPGPKDRPVDETWPTDGM